MKKVILAALICAALLASCASTGNVEMLDYQLRQANEKIASQDELVRKLQAENEAAKAMVKEMQAQLDVIQQSNQAALAAANSAKESCDKAMAAANSMGDPISKMSAVIDAWEVYGKELEQIIEKYKENPNAPSI